MRNYFEQLQLGRYLKYLLKRNISSACRRYGISFYCTYDKRLVIYIQVISVDMCGYVEHFISQNLDFITEKSFILYN